MKNQYVKNIKDKDYVDDEFMVVKVETPTTKTGNLYLKLMLADKTGGMPAVKWGDPHPLPVVGQVYTFSGQGDFYQGKPQIKLDQISPRVSETDEDFEECSHRNIEEMWVQFQRHISGFENRWFAEVVADLFNKYKDEFKTSPAATGMHHFYKGGLLEHTLEMADAADLLLQMPCFKPLNKDLCKFGILLHDFGKLFEYSQNATRKRTLQGVLSNHLTMTAAMVHESANKVGTPEIIRDSMSNTILGHHGSMEWGSPVLAAYPEGWFVHHVDNLFGTVMGQIHHLERRANKAEELYTNPVNRVTLVVQPFNEIVANCEKSTAEATESFDLDNIPF